MDRGILAPSKPQGGHRRSKSSTAVLKSIITSKGHSKSTSKGKENTTPPTSAASSKTPIATPLWAELNRSSSQRHGGQLATTARIPLNDRAAEEESKLHTSNDYFSSKQSIDRVEEAPSRTRCERPKSVVIEKSESAFSIFESMARMETKQYDITTPTEMHAEATRKTTKVPLKPEGGAERLVKATRSTSRDLLTMAKRGTKVMGLVAAFNKTSESSQEENLLGTASTVDEAFEAVLESRNIPENMRKNLRMLKPVVKANLIKSNDIDFAAVAQSKSPAGTVKDKGQRSRDQDDHDKEDSPDIDKKTPKRSRPRSRTFTLSRSKKTKNDEVNPSAKSGSFVRSSSAVSLDGRVSLDGSRSAAPDEFVTYLRTEKSPPKMSIGKIHKLRQLLRNETVAWVEKFVELGGLAEIVSLLNSIMQLEWREEHEDQLLHETLLCLKALSTTDSALQKLAEIADTLFPALLAMLFDKERKGPSEYTTRGVIISILMAHLKTAITDLAKLSDRARIILGYLSDPQSNDNELPFITGMRQSRPFKLWHQEVLGVSREVFWIYLHHHNIVALPSESEEETTKYPDVKSLEKSMTASEFMADHFPRPRPPVPAAPYVGGVEWDATNYIAAHLDLLNGLIAALPTREERNEVRAKLRCSYWEKTMGGTLRTCKEKFYVCIHDALRVWVAAAVADGWDVRDVRMGPKIDKMMASPRKSPAKKKTSADDKAPVLDAPKLDLDLNLGGLGSDDDEARRFL